jgi:hypothetical protein
MLLAHGNAGHAERRGLAQHVEREMAVAVPVERMGRHAVVGEGAGHVAHRGMVLRKGKGRHAPR